jgi:hypothetical protein
MSNYNNVNSYKNINNLNPNWVFDNLTKFQKKYVERIKEFADDLCIDTTDLIFSRKQLQLISLSFKDNNDIPNWIVKDKARRAGVGVYIIPEVREHIHGTKMLTEDDTAPHTTNEELADMAASSRTTVDTFNADQYDLSALEG